MEYRTKSGDLAKSKAHCILVAVYKNNRLSDSATQLDKASGGHITNVLKQGDIQGKSNQVLVLRDLPNISAPRVMLLGLGDADTIDDSRFNSVLGRAIAQLKTTQATTALCCLLEVKVRSKDIYWKTRRLVEQFEQGIYSFTEMKSKAAKKTKLAKIELNINHKDDSSATKATIKAAVNHGSAVAKGVAAARNLANTPGNLCTPTYMAKASRNLAKHYPSISTSVLEEKDMERLGMGALLSVSKGSAEPAKLICIQHKGTKPSTKPHVLVGKGISFDSGGISLKPGATMYEMIYDMCGAASVFGTMTSIAEMNLPINVTGVISSAENMPSGTASRPGDIVTSMSGQTIEILNTDAEGRLVLCDALTYIEKFKPETVIDVATLTGACVVALGSHASALFANDDVLADHINKAGEETLDRVWRMPMWEDYQKQINSVFADMANVGGREAGSITAACFLARFTKKYRWAHLDIAGSAYKTGASKGATGRPVTLLCQYLLDRMND